MPESGTVSVQSVRSQCHFQSIVSKTDKIISLNTDFNIVYFKRRRGDMNFYPNHDERETLGPNKTRWIRFCGQISKKYVKIWGSRQNREFSKIVDIFDTKLGLEI